MAIRNDIIPFSNKNSPVMCIFAKLLNVKKEKPLPELKLTSNFSLKAIVQKIINPIDRIKFISFHFAVFAFTVLCIGWYFTDNKTAVSIVDDSYAGWLGIIVDAMLLYFINWAIRREEKDKLIDQFGSESNAFALDATKRLRKKGWLLDGTLIGIQMGHAQLSKANLSKAQIQQVDFSYSSMQNTILVEADLSKSNLTGADLSGAECRWANFEGANLRWANLEGASLDGVNFDGADLRFAKLGKLNSNTISMKGALRSESLSVHEVALVQKSAEHIHQSIEEFSMDFYAELFQANPLVKKLFLLNIKSQAVKFAQLLELLISSLNNVEKLIPALKSLGKRHVNYGVNEGHYDIVGGALIRTLQNKLGDAFTPEVKDAWLKTYSLVTMIMVDSGKGLI